MKKVKGTDRLDVCFLLKVIIHKSRKTQLNLFLFSLFILSLLFQPKFMVLVPTQQYFFYKMCFFAYENIKKNALKSSILYGPAQISYSVPYKWLTEGLIYNEFVFYYCPEVVSKAIKRIQLEFIH